MERAMQLNHIDLAVPDVALTAAFFKTVFDFVEIETKGNAGMAVLTGGGFELVLTRMNATPLPPYPKTFHIGFLVSSEEHVRDAYRRVIEAVVEPCDPPRSIRGNLMFYCHAPGAILIEVSHRPAG
jgi:lactoylglutathione lyase